MAIHASYQLILPSFVVELRIYIYDSPSITAELPVVGVVPAELDVGPAGSLLQSGLSHFQRTLLVSQGLFQRLDQHLGLEDLLQSLDEEMETEEKMKSQEIYKVIVGAAERLVYENRRTSAHYRLQIS